MNLSDWAAVATVVGSVAGVLALVYTAREIRKNTVVHRAKFWLTLRQMFADHAATHRKLRDGEWPGDLDPPPSKEDWAALEAYMGLFEHCEAMLADGLLDWRTFHDIYGYRLKLITRYPLIVRDKLILRREGWLRFVDLLERMGGEIPARRYLCGFAEHGTGQWTLWLGSASRAERRDYFAEWPALRDGYDQAAARAGRAGQAIDHGWLFDPDGTVVRRLPAVPTPATQPAGR